jgi:hypothetical protein
MKQIIREREDQFSREINELRAAIREELKNRKYNLSESEYY